MLSDVHSPLQVTLTINSDFNVHNDIVINSGAANTGIPKKWNKVLTNVFIEHMHDYEDELVVVIPEESWSYWSISLFLISILQLFMDKLLQCLFSST